MSFSILMNGTPLDFEMRAALDGQAIQSGQHVPLGSHQLTVSHPNAEPYSTNIFVWYGENNLGQLELRRQMGTLAVSARPTALILSIQGANFTQRLTNCPGVTSSVPTGRYVIEASYPFSRESSTADVTAAKTEYEKITALLGSVRIEANREDTTFQLRSQVTGRVLREGTLPVTVEDLPTGNYAVTMRYHGDEQDKSFTVKTGETNSIRFEFSYGTAVLDSDPPGASVIGSDGEQKGVTPLTLAELKPGHWQFTLRKEGYEASAASLEIVAGETNRFRTNLVNHEYSQQMAIARQHLTAGEFDEAVSSARQALIVKPDDSVASDLIRQATGRDHLDKAARSLAESNYTAARSELALAAGLVPEDQRVAQIGTQLQRREAEQADRDRQERKTRPQRAFNSTAAAMRYEGQTLPEQTLTAKMSVTDAETAIEKSFRDQDPHFTITAVTMPVPESFGFLAWEPYLSGGRRCAIAGAQTADNETEIIFRVVEYRATYRANVQGLFNVETSTAYDPIVDNVAPDERSRQQEGLKLVTERIKQVIGQSGGK